MHERSVAQAIYRQVERTEREQQGLLALACEVEIGPLSGIEALCLQSAFADLMNEFGREIHLTIQEVPLRGRCGDCDTESSIDAYDFHCAACGSPRLQITSGDQIQLAHIDLA
ncbi:MAG: hydrogenase maturation nickel metallochaperone HypA [Pirellulaceae bacterium]|nr:hydrogenase maturation nickel metallochaperone HypA [Pirellulaceae bacterium]